MPPPKTPQEYAEALKKVGADPRCPSCGAENWFMAPEAAIPGEKVGRMPVHKADCLKCGFVRLHVGAAIDLMRPPLSDAAR